MGFRDWFGNRTHRVAVAAPEPRPARMTEATPVALINGPDDVEVVGESHYQDSLWAIVGGDTGARVRHDVSAILVAETDNRFDENAVSVWVMGHKVGYLSRADATRLRPGLSALEQRHRKSIALTGTIVGGGRNDGRIGMLGVFLNYDAVEFGLPRGARTYGPARATGGVLRTGLSQAMATDAADNSYDLSWLHSLPGEPTRRVRRLHELLAQERDLISRHFLFAEIESTLYGVRDTGPGALIEYDETCRRHDYEMNDIVPVLAAKFGAVPLLETYRQSAIRHQKAKNLDKALWWAERGIALYGDRPAKSEMVLDLHKRAGTYRAALGQPPAQAPGEIEVLVCQRCQREFQRARTRGRKPLLCLSCR